MNYEETYEKNRAALNEYQWWRHGLLPDYKTLAIKAEANVGGGMNIFSE